MELQVELQVELWVELQVELRVQVWPVGVGSLGLEARSSSG